MKAMNKYLKINILLFVFLYLSISFNKEYLRPLYGHLQLSGTLLGSYPNFIAAFIISPFPLKHAMMLKANKGRIIIYSTSFIVFAILSIEEWKPFFHASSVFDIYDIIASGIGALFAIITFELLLRKRK